MDDHIEIRTVWKSTAEQCEVVWGRFLGCHTRLWVSGRLIVDELAADIDTAIDRAWQLRDERRALAGR